MTKMIFLISVGEFCLSGYRISCLVKCNPITDFTFTFNEQLRESAPQTPPTKKKKAFVNSEAVTMYKLKGQSTNMRTGQSFENKELVSDLHKFGILVS